MLLWPPLSSSHCGGSSLWCPEPDFTRSLRNFATRYKNKRTRDRRTLDHLEHSLLSFTCKCTHFLAGRSSTHPEKVGYQSMRSGLSSLTNYSFMDWKLQCYTRHHYTKKIYLAYSALFVKFAVNKTAWTGLHERYNVRLLTRTPSCSLFSIFCALCVFLQSCSIRKQSL